LEPFLIAIEQSAIGDAMRSWRWLYPIVNTAHIFGISLLFGALIPLHLARFSVWKTVDAGTLSRVLVPTVIAGLVLPLLRAASCSPPMPGNTQPCPCFRSRSG